MNTITTKAVAKVAAVATGLAMATSVLSLAPLAHAADCSVGTANLTVGSVGAAVSCLQQNLIASGYSIPAGATGYFGMQTKAAVAAWQAAFGISPAAGYFGPISRSRWSGSTTVSTGGTTGGSTVPGCLPGYAFSPTTGQACTGGTTVTGLTGTGRLTNISSYGSVLTDLKEGDPTTAVVGVQADAIGGDVAIQRVDATFYVDDVGAQSSNLDRYVSDVELWINGVKVATMDPSLGDKSGRVWTYRFSGLNTFVKSGTTANIVVEVTPLTSIGTNEDGAGVIGALLANSVRAVGADGISDTYVVGATVTQGSAGTADTVSGTAGQRFTVSSATTGSLTVTAAADNPSASQVAVSSSTTTGVKLLSFNMKAKNQDVKVTDLVASFGTSDTNLSDVVNTVYLMKGSTVLKSTTLSTGAYQAVTFSNVNDTIAKDQTNNYTIVADLKGDSAYVDGTTLVASTTVSGWDVSDANGASVTPSAAAVGNTMTLTATGMSVALGTPTATVQTASFSGGVDSASFAIPFTVTAGDSDIYIGGATTIGTGTNAGDVTFGTTTTSTTGATTQPTSNISVANTVTGDSAGSYYKVLAGTSRTFTLNATVQASSAGVTAGYVGMIINSIAYGTVAGTETNYYTSHLDTFKTNDVYVTKH